MKTKSPLSILRSPLFILFLILLVASFLRLYHLESNPPSPYWEETALGYDAYSIAKTGKDFHGNPYPILAFPSFGDYKPSGYFYAEVPFIKALGLNLLAVRLPSALAGIVSVGILYLIGKELFDRRVGLIASALLAVSPWGLQFSRGGWEVNFALMCVMLGSWLLILSRRKIWVLPLSVLFFGYSMYTYHAARVFSPLVGILGGLLLLNFWRLNKSFTRTKIIMLGISLMLALAITLPLIINLKSSSVSSRFDATSIFTDPSPVLESNKQVALHGNTRLAKIIYHRYWYFGALIAQGFMKHFSPQFLFVHGDGNLRHSTVAFGLFYYIDALFILLALVFAIRRKKKRVLILVACILFAAVAPSLVTPTPHALRFLFALPAFILLAAIGLDTLITYTHIHHLRAGSLGILLVYLVFVANYLFYYHTGYPIKAASDWQYGYKQLYEDLGKDKKVGELVYVSREQGRPSMYYLFYSVYDPAKIQAQGPSLPKDQLELLQIGDYHFVDGIPGGKGLFATSASKVDPKAQVLDSIKNLDGSVVWVIWRRS